MKRELYRQKVNNGCVVVTEERNGYIAHRFYDDYNDDTPSNHFFYYGRQEALEWAIGLALEYKAAKDMED